MQGVAETIVTHLVSMHHRCSYCETQIKIDEEELLVNRSGKLHSIVSLITRLWTEINILSRAVTRKFTIPARMGFWPPHIRP